jgi:hypothetical protein
MLKGVNRQVVEICQPENKYFERILLFVRPEYSGLSEARLTQQAQSAIPDTPRLPGTKKRSTLRFWELLRAALCAGAGAGILALAELLVSR